MHKQNGISSIEVAMLFVVVSIVAVVALPVVVPINKNIDPQLMDSFSSTKKVKSAYALALAQTGDFPRLSDIVEYVDADFASEKNDLSGIIFRDGGNRLTINTYSDLSCKHKTSNKQPGVTDIVRCI